MSSAPTRALLALGAAAALFAPGCGDSNNDPKSVLLRATTALYGCGAKSAATVYDLSTNHFGQDRATYIRNQLASEQHNGCTPMRVPQLEPIQLSRTDSVATYDLRLDKPSTTFKGGRIRLLKTEHGWKVDNGAGT